MYLIRLDDASEYWNKTNWERMHLLLQKYGIKPIVAIIPHNEDRKLIQYHVDANFWQLISDWNDDGWTPALHGYNHVLLSPHGGVNPVNHRSEFAGVDLETQREKIREGYRELSVHGINAKIFVAPAHTYDENTLLALKEETEIRIISDTIASDIYKKNDFFYIPLQSGSVRKIRLKLVTFCYHPNMMNDASYEALEDFISEYKNDFTSFDKLVMKDRKYSIFDKVLRTSYFAMRKIR